MVFVLIHPKIMNFGFQQFELVLMQITIEQVSSFSFLLEHLY